MDEGILDGAEKIENNRSLDDLELTNFNATETEIIVYYTLNYVISPQSIDGKSLVTP